MFDKVKVNGTKVVSTYIMIVVQLSKCTSDLLHDLLLYRINVGALQYCILIRPKINFLVNKLYQFLYYRIMVSLVTSKRMLKYVNIMHGLMLYKLNNLSLIAYINVD